MPRLRLATQADLAPCWALRTRALRIGCAAHYGAGLVDILCASAPPASMPQLLQAGTALVAEEEGRIVGYAVLDGARGEVEAAFVEPAWQRRGIARQLLRELEKLALERNLDTLFLSASLNAVAFYERAGFQRLRDELYPHRSGIAIASVYMEKRLRRPG